jgi:predicted molibdopterin-dependent oxidoreductase YjgC
VKTSTHRIVKVAERYTEPRLMRAEGATIGLTTCLRCGACIMLDPDELNLADVDAVELHERFHVDWAYVSSRAYTP